MHRKLTAIVVLLSVWGMRPGAPPASMQDRFELEEATLAEMQAWMASGRYTSRRLTELYLQRIANLDRSGLALQSIAEINPDALTIAAALDEERKSKGSRGPLHG